MRGRFWPTRLPLYPDLVCLHGSSIVSISSLRLPDSLVKPLKLGVQLLNGNQVALRHHHSRVTW